MIVLDSTSETLQIVLAGAVATAELQCYAAYRDITTTDYTPGSNQVLTNGTTDRNLVDAPAISTQRVIDYVSIFNADTAAATVTVKYDDTLIERIIHKATLATGEKLEYCEGVGWRTFNAAGVVVGVGNTGAAGAPGGGTVLGTGSSVIDFGSAGASHVSLDVTGQAAILAGSLVYCWVKPEATVDHSADEHMVETIKVHASDVIAGTGFTLHAFNTSQTVSAGIPDTAKLGRYSGTGAASGGGQAARNQPVNRGGEGTLLTGKWSVKSKAQTAPFYRSALSIRRRGSKTVQSTHLVWGTITTRDSPASCRRHSRRTRKSFSSAGPTRRASRSSARSRSAPASQRRSLRPVCRCRST